MKVRVLYVVAVSSAIFCSWLITYVFECYYYGSMSRPSRHPRDAQPPFPDGNPDNIFWFLQISDIHLSYVNKFSVAKDLTYFCSETVDVVNPAVVLVTGDLTHAKYPNERHSRQFEEEWLAYAEVLSKTKVTERVPWLDIRGNHDAFDVLSPGDRGNRFLLYSASWQHYGSFSYRYTHHTPFGNYSFLAFDACPSPGPKRPYNFFGILHNEDLEALKLLAAGSLHDNHTMWFSHYPSATITGNHHALRSLMSHSVAHVCGHLHTLAHLAPHMYGRHPGGHLELELGDFRDYRRFRLLAFDHDLLSFTDVTLRQWPLVLVTNPKDAHFLAPSREPIGRIGRSSHVRVLAFSPSPITSVRAHIDGRPLPPLLKQGKGPLYTIPWQPEGLARGLHTIEVTVQDSAGRERSVTQRFSLDATIPPLLLLPRLLLLSDLESLLQMGFHFLWLTLLACLLLSWTHSGKASSSRGKASSSLCHPLPPPSRAALFPSAQSFHFQPLVRTKSVFYPLLGYIVYFGIGPWYVGELLTGMYGWVSVRGVRVAGHFLPGSMTYLHGVIEVLTFQIPLTCYLNHMMSHDRNVCCSALWHIVFSFSLLWQCGLVYSLTTYGILPLVLSPGMAWSIPLSLFLVYRASRLTGTCTNRPIT